MEVALGKMVSQMVLNYVPNDVVDEVLAGYHVGSNTPSERNRRITYQNIPDEWKCNIRKENEWKTSSSRNRKPVPYNRQQNKNP